MTYRFSAEPKAKYLHAKGSGELNAINARQFLVDAYQACVQRNLKSLLLEMDFTGRNMGLGEVYSVVAERSPDGAKLERIAYFDAHVGDRQQIAEFAELVAQNRFVSVRLFSQLSDAERWLQSE
jgi:hypothetical protein